MQLFQQKVSFMLLNLTAAEYYFPPFSRSI